MTKKTVDELPDITDTQEENALTIIQQNGQTFKGRERPNPPRKVNVTTQAQLETLFGPDIEIPDGQSWEISIDDNMTITKPIKIGNGSAVRIIGGTSSITLTYTGFGLGAMFQNTLPTDVIDSFDLRLIAIAGGALTAVDNNAFDLVGGVNSFFFINTAQINFFDDIGFVDVDLVEIQSLGMFFNNQGFVIQDPGAMSANVVVFDQNGKGDTGMTAFSIIQADPTLVILDDVRGRGLSVGENLVFFDSNAPTGAAFVITNATKNAGSLFQSGAPNTIDAVTDGAPNAIFDTTSAHGFIVGQVVVLSGFVTNTAYNGTFMITAVPTTSTFETGVAFGTNETIGSVNEKSLDSTDVLVSSFNNPGEPESMFTAESGFEDGSATATVMGASPTPVVIVNVNNAFSNLERFSQGVVNEGQIVADDPSTRRYAVTYSGSLTKTTGGTLFMGVVLLKNGSLVGFNPPRSPDVSSAQVTGTNIIELAQNDTLQVAVVNYVNSDDITVTHVDLVVNRA